MLTPTTQESRAFTVTTALEGVKPARTSFRVEVNVESDVGEVGPIKANDEGSESDSRMAWNPVQSGASSGQETTEGEVSKIDKSSLPAPLQSQHVSDSVHERDLSPSCDGDHDMEELIVRDGAFYIEDADCVVRVGNTLFRVHRYFLGRDSAFQDMFNIPTQNHDPSLCMKGGSDENPLRLYGESIERFRALLSIIYQTPLQLLEYSTPAGDVDKLLNIAEITNKYRFASMEMWAVSALYHVTSGLHGPPQPQHDLRHCSSAWMKRLLEVAVLCQHTALCNYVTERWVDRIIARDLRPIYALEIADRNGIRRLKGYAYYVQLLEMDDNFEPGVAEDSEHHSRAPVNVGRTEHDTSTTTQSGPPVTLTHEQRERLLFGHWSLSRLWYRLQKNPLRFEQANGCTNHEQGCVSTWRKVWLQVGRSEATLKYSAADVPGRLRAMENQVLMYADIRIRMSRGMDPLCGLRAIAALKVAIKEVQEGLADHFVHARKV